jgi:DNA-binding XRE family transcriptional regulator
MDIPKRLKKLREARGWNVSELARASGLSQPYLRQIELGIKRNPSAAVLNQLAVALGVTVADIMGTSVAIPASSLEEAPDSLRELVRKQGKQLGLRQEDVEMLKGIHFRGRRPERSEDWELIFLLLKRLLG